MSSMEIPLVDVCTSSWKKTLNAVSNAVVFIDPKASECLHWSGGVSRLLNSKPAAVHEFSAYKYFQVNHVENIPKAAFITSGPLTSTLVELCDILSHSTFKNVVLIIPPVNDMTNTVQKIQQDILEWMAVKRGATQELHAEVLSFPFFIAALTDSVFMLPEFSEFFPPLDCNKLGITRGSKSSESSIPPKMMATAAHLATVLNGVLDQFNVRDTAFSMGPLSSAVASVMENLPAVQHRRKVAHNSMTVLLVDRTLDLCTPCSVNRESFLDKMLCALPHLPEHSIDVAINMSQLTQVTVDSVQEESLFPGCLAHSDAEYRPVLDWLIHKKDREIILNLHELMKKDTSGPVKLKTRLKPEVLERDVRQFRGNYKQVLSRCGILQVALGVVQTLTGEHAEELEVMLGVEKVLRQNLASLAGGAEIEGLLPQVTKLVTERHIRGLPLDALLTLMICLYSLVGLNATFPLRDEVQLQAAISSALFEDQEYPGLVHALLMPLESSKETANSVAGHVFASLKAVANARKDLTNFRSIMQGAGSAIPFECKPLIPRLLEDILDPSRPPVPDLTCRSTGLRDLLKTGFNMLLSKSHPSNSQHPADQPHLLLLILGGITGDEIQSAQNIWNQSALGKGGGKLFVCSTRLLSPTDTLQMVLKSTPL